MRMESKLFLLVAVLVLGGPIAVAGSAQPATAYDREFVTARLGISAGAAIEDAPLGLDGPELRGRIPILFETAERLDIRVETVSVGQGFFADEGMLLSEKDLDLVVSGRRERIATMAATLGREFDQSVVFIWFFGSDAGQSTATLPLPDGAEALTDGVYQQLVTELADGGHVRSAGNHDLIFVANTGDEPDADFFARMERVRTLLAGAGIPTGAVHCDRADFLAIERDSYDQILGGGSGAPMGQPGRQALHPTERVPAIHDPVDAGLSVPA